MVATASSFTNSRYSVSPGQGFDGVVRISYSGYYGTGALLFGGRAVLTCAHLFSHNDVATATASVSFDTITGNQQVASSRIAIIPGFDANANNDLALVWLSSSAPITAERYTLYRSSDEIGQTMTMVGYGNPGSGDTGTLTSYSGAPLRLKASNQFDADIGTLANSFGSTLGWQPTTGTQLVADFDNGTTTNDALGRLLNISGTGLGLNEGLIASGDSGGPAFINGKIAGIASYTASLHSGFINPDIDTIANSSFGEIAAWQRISHYQQWVDQSLRADYSNAPTTPSEVQKTVIEGNTGTTYAYFLLQFLGLHIDPNQALSVDYTTRDGTATSGQDYLPINGKLVIYPNESHVAIPVEIIGDNLAEPDETFYLDVFNPVGGSFGQGMITLTAMRTIANDDGSLVA
ncbi:MAG: trypsin-like serine protease [Methylococcales bacterium]|nr:trypsin-like serine protease [Methylococcales bacterium]